MPLVVRDGNGATQNLPNAGIDSSYFAIEPATVTTTFTSATDVYQFVGAAGTVTRFRRMEFWAGAIVAASTTFAASSMLVQVLRRSTAGTTGTWTAFSTAIARSAFAATAPATVVNVAGTTAFTVGTTQGTVRRGYILFPMAPATNALNLGLTPLVFNYGTLGNSPLSITGTADFVVVNLNGVTPVGPIQANFEWEEATF